MLPALLSPCLTALLALGAPEAPKKAKPKPPVAQQKAKTSTAAARPKSPAEALLDKVQRYYESTDDFIAEFTQKYTRVALSKSYESSGEVAIKKPGMMRWDYKKPAPKLFVADGQKLSIYEPEEEQVIEDASFKANELSSSIRFLWGAGKLADSFNVKTAEAKGAKPGSKALELTPKSEATYTKIILIVDGETGQVQESIIHESTGNTNHFLFKNVRTNSGIKPDLFKFTPPPGVEVIKRPVER